MLSGETKVVVDV